MKRNPKLYAKNVVKAVALVKEVAVITVAGASMVGKPGSAARIFDVMGRSGINVLMISQSVSESNISMVVARSTMERGANALELALLGQGGFRHIHTENDVSAIAVVGGGMRSVKGIAATAFGADCRERDQRQDDRLGLLQPEPLVGGGERRMPRRR